MENLFRKESLQEINSPEQLNQYIKVTGPGVWMILSAIVIFLAGVLVWAIFGKVQSSVPCAVTVDDGKAVCYIADDKVDRIKPGMPLLVQGKQFTIDDVDPEPIVMDDMEDHYLMRTGGFEDGQYCFLAESTTDGIPDGIYSAKIITESISPIHFVIH